MILLRQESSIDLIPSREAREIARRFVMVKEVFPDGTATVCSFNGDLVQTEEVEDTHTRDLGEIEDRTRDLKPKEEEKVLTQLDKYDSAKNEKQKSRALGSLEKVTGMKSRDLKKIMYNKRRRWKKSPLYVGDIRINFPSQALEEIVDYDPDKWSMKGANIVETYNNYRAGGLLFLSKEILKQAIKT